MTSERVPHMPAKARLTWRIHRLRLTEDELTWVATGSKDGRVSVIELPTLPDAGSEFDWIAEIEARFERHALDPTADNYADILRSSASGAQSS